MAGDLRLIQIMLEFPELTVQEARRYAERREPVLPTGRDIVPLDRPVSRGLRPVLPAREVQQSPASH